MKLHGLLVSIIVGLSACAVGPNYQRPAMPLAAQFENQTTTQAEPIAQFWQRFNDPALNTLVELALKNNHDVRIAVANLREARAAQTEIDAGALPLLSSGISGQRNVQPQTQRPNTTREQRTQNVYDVNLDASWEINFFGRYRRASEAAQAEASAAEAGLDAAQLSVVAEVARWYFEWRGLQQRLDIARNAERNQSEALKLVEARLQAGRGTELDTARALSLVENTRATLPQLEAALARTRYRLNVLTGQWSNTVQQTLNQAAGLPALPVVQALGTPDTLLRRRPDVRIAERQLAAATARIGVTTTELYPRMSLTGGLGLNAGRLNTLTDSAAFTYNIGASLVWTVFDFGRIRARIRQAEARTEAALAEFEKTVLVALEETEGALVQFNRVQKQTDNLFNATQASAKASQLARARFEAGVSDFLTVLDAERQWLSDQDRLAQAQTQAATSLVAVYKALAGGWGAGSTR